MIRQVNENFVVILKGTRVLRNPSQTPKGTIYSILSNSTSCSPTSLVGLT
eukprot:m.59797 g.59797  ORF g.59797 m.59797 type:complete len:50 (+) comp9478_c0_seq1:1489-1638(+)